MSCCIIYGCHGNNLCSGREELDWKSQFWRWDIPSGVQLPTNFAHFIIFLEQTISLRLFFFILIRCKNVHLPGKCWSVAFSLLLDLLLLTYVPNLRFRPDPGVALLCFAKKGGANTEQIDKYI